MLRMAAVASPYRDWTASFKSAGIFVVRFADRDGKPVWKGGLRLTGMDTSDSTNR